MSTEIKSEGLTDDLKVILRAAAGQKYRVKFLQDGVPDFLKKVVDATGYYTGSTDYCTNKHADGQLTFSTNKGRAEFVTLFFHPGAQVEIIRVLSSGRDGNDVKACPSWDYSQSQNVGEAVQSILRQMADLDPEGFGKYIDNAEFDKKPEPATPAPGGS